MFAKRIQGMTTSIFTIMSKLAFEYQEVNLVQGFPDFNGPEWIFDEAFKAMKEGKNQYAPMPGIMSLRRTLAANYKKYYDIDIDETNGFCITAGATEALYSAITAYVEPGDEVIMFEPVYDAHLADVMIAGGTPKFITLMRPDFSFDAAELEATVNNKTKMIILNNPHNPTGKVYTREELELIAKIAIEHNLIVLSDEVYEFITYDGTKHIPLAGLPGMFNRTITISSSGKTFSLTGWKTGWACGSPELIEGVKKMHQWTTFAVNTPAQHAMAFAFTKLEEYLPDFREMYLHKRDLMYNLLLDTPFKPHKPAGSYFMMVDLPDENLDAEKIADDLVKNHKVATIPPHVFYGKSGEGRKMLRLCFAKNDETIIKGIENLKKYG
jgi:N-succinyldiaminopimelate aminotransferase